jgi:hypothetical protein
MKKARRVGLEESQESAQLVFDIFPDAAEWCVESGRQLHGDPDM